MKKKWFCTALAAVSAVALSLVACGQADEPNDSIASLKSDVSRLQNEKLSDESHISSLEADSAAKDARIAELELEIAALTAVPESTIDEDQTADSDTGEDYAGVYYDSLEELVAMYRSGAWNGDTCCRRDGRLWATMNTRGELEEGERNESFGYYDYDFSGTGIYPDLPDGYIHNGYERCWYDSMDEVFTCLESDGLHRYHHGQETGFWPISGVDEESKLFRFSRYGICVIAGGCIIQCTDDGEVLTLAEGVIGFYMNDSGTIDVFTFHDGEIQLWVCYYGEDVRHTVASGVTAAACTSTPSNFDNYLLNVIFTDTSGYTYFVEYEDMDVECAIRTGDFNPELLYQHRLGQETPDYYVLEYIRIVDACREAWRNGEEDQPRPVKQFLEQYDFNPSN